MSNQQKVAIVTGASQGIGAGIVRGFRARQYRVVATSRTIAPSGDEGVVSVAGDITDPRTAERVVAAALERFGRIDTLVNNAGIYIGKPFTSYTEDDFAAVIGINLGGFFRLTQRAIAEMEKRSAGHVVNITGSVEHARSAAPGVLAALSKGGLSVATRSLAIEYARRGIRVNAVAPGIVKTPMHPVETLPALEGFHPLGRLGDVDDIVEAVLYLESARYVTGAVLYVDGGENAGY